MTDVTETDPREALPFLDKHVGNSGGMRVLRTLLVVLAVLILAAGFAGALLLNAFWPLLIGLLVFVITAGIDGFLNDSATVRLARAREGAAWAQSRYGLQLSDDEAVALFYNPQVPEDRQPRTIQLNGTTRYGVTSTDRYQDGLQLLYNVEHGYHIVNLGNAREIKTV